jgi:hypothetical protein
MINACEVMLRISSNFYYQIAAVRFANFFETLMQLQLDSKLCILPHQQEAHAARDLLSAARSLPDTIAAF